jgi:acylphosphatase
MDQTAKHVIFRGNVQGVGFRYTTYRIAGRYEVSGFVRNLPDGTVEMLAQGPPAEVEQCLEDVQDSFSGYIREAKVEQIPYHPQYHDFSITR